MTINLHYDSLFPSLFKTTLNAFKAGAKEIGKSILMDMIFAFKKTNTDLKKILIEIEKNPNKALELDTIEFHDDMLKLEDMLEAIVKNSTKHKEDSEVFIELYSIADELYTITIKLGMTVSTTAIKLRHELERAS
ncbi:MAG: hypothetical protein A2513_04355 [Sulfurimonas sp. RIFOXYD12_FULL_33_39]|uniref:hypothetical protein n=1 Tax=unclassified Sulfurimonas TaxID=2623549 RepID=UPI0008C2CE87|nr:MULTISPECIES: hypothetical protein [unclassified Sulfurimonas]OHE09366.1 MAG: hypothetical protein A2513_04355 [Sulfurimonas sp. RIFOXYD12_FULL_33_39]OHE12851.1 MAG: hypothetical protein A2530_04450 [Sulfurimonas sp. RIFOXYD2_FULL_34_21]